MTEAASRLPQQALLLAAARAAGQLVMVVVQAVVAREIGASRFGVLASALALAATLSGFIDFGAGAYWIREVSSGRMTAEDFRSRSAGKIAVGLLIACGLFVVGTSGVAFALLVPASGFLLASVWSQTLQTALIAAGMNVRLSVIALIERLTLGFAFLFLSRTSLSVEFVFVLAYLCGSAVTVWLASRSARHLRPDLRHVGWRRTWSGAGYYGLSTSLISLQSTDVLIAGAIAGQDVAGSYGAVARWTMPIVLASQAFAVLLNPVVASARDRLEVWKRLRGALWLPSLSIVSAIAMLIVAEPLILFVLGSGFQASVMTLRFLALAAGLSACSQVAFTVLQARGRERVAARALALSVSTQLALVAPLAQLMGAAGVALAALAGQGALLLVVGIAVFRIWGSLGGLRHTQEDG
ncbi:MAG: oligosaccharide flippase family protein [Acidobacteriota bacterium]|nr:oligosaccharide flippase family protein [Acidobacteriota bacterium]